MYIGLYLLTGTPVASHDSTYMKKSCSHSAARWVKRQLFDSHDFRLHRAVLRSASPEMYIGFFAVSTRNCAVSGSSRSILSILRFTTVLRKWSRRTLKKLYTQEYTF